MVNFLPLRSTIVIILPEIGHSLHNKYTSVETQNLSLRLERLILKVSITILYEKAPIAAFYILYSIVQHTIVQVVSYRIISSLLISII